VINIHIFHKWYTVKENAKWKLEKCKKCGKERWNENLLVTGYMPKP
jgi:hypothetical protein